MVITKLEFISRMCYLYKLIVRRLRSFRSKRLYSNPTFYRVSTFAVLQLIVGNSCFVSHYHFAECGRPITAHRIYMEGENKKFRAMCTFLPKPKPLALLNGASSTRSVEACKNAARLRDRLYVWHVRELVGRVFFSFFLFFFFITQPLAVCAREMAPKCTYGQSDQANVRSAQCQLFKIPQH